MLFFFLWDVIDKVKKDNDVDGNDSVSDDNDENSYDNDDDNDIGLYYRLCLSMCSTMKMMWEM